MSTHYMEGRILNCPIHQWCSAYPSMQTRDIGGMSVHKFYIPSDHTWVHIPWGTFLFSYVDCYEWCFSMCCSNLESINTENYIIFTEWSTCWWILMFIDRCNLITNRRRSHQALILVNKSFKETFNELSSQLRPTTTDIIYHWAQSLNYKEEEENKIKCVTSAYSLW